jgi:hypothetical protein
MKRWIDGRVREGEFADPGRVLEHAIRRERALRATEGLEKAALEGLLSGPTSPLTRADLKRIEAEALRKAALRPRRRSA